MATRTARNYLVRKDNTTSYYYRSIVPKDLIPLLERKEFRVSLRTGLLSEGKKLSIMCHTLVTWLYDYVRFTRLSTGNSCEFKFTHRLTGIIRLTSMGQNKTLTIEAIKKIIKEYLSEVWEKGNKVIVGGVKHNRTVEEYEQEVDAVSGLVSDYKEQVYNGNFSSARKTANAYIDKYGIKVDESTENYKSLCKNIMIADIHAMERQIESVEYGDFTKGTYVEDVVTEEMPETEKRTKDTDHHKHRYLLSEVVDEYINDAADDVTLKTIKEYRAALTLFIRIIGDMYCDELDFAVLRNFKKTLALIPPNINKNVKYIGLSIEEIIQFGDAPISKRTRSNNMTRVSQLLGWAKRFGYVPENYAEGMKEKITTAPNEERDKFDDNDLSLIFNPMTFLKASEARPSRYWAPILALFTGARQNEICQLFVEDVKKSDEGIWYIDFTPDEKGVKKVKNKSSKRITPLHSTVIKLGFLDYVNNVRNKTKDNNKQLFPEIKPDLNGFGKDVSRWFSKYRKKVGISSHKKNFHSFRHTLITQLKHKLVNETCLSEMVGHEVEGETLSRYGKKYDACTLYNEVIDKLDFSFIDWSKLKT